MGKEREGEIETYERESKIERWRRRGREDGGQGVRGERGRVWGRGE